MKMLCKPLVLMKVLMLRSQKSKNREVTCKGYIRRKKKYSAPLKTTQETFEFVFLKEKRGSHAYDLVTSQMHGPLEPRGKHAVRSLLPTRALLSTSHVTGKSSAMQACFPNYKVRKIYIVSPISERLRGKLPMRRALNLLKVFSSRCEQGLILSTSPGMEEMKK